MGKFGNKQVFPFSLQHTASQEEDEVNITTLLADVNIPALIQLRQRDLKRACPNGTEYCICANNPKERTYGPFSWEEGIFGAFFTYSVCSPGICFCMGDPNTPQAWDIFCIQAVLQNRTTAYRTKLLMGHILPISN